MKKALFIVGLTASGKTQLGIQIAQKINGAIVSADSIQVYKGLDIISGKDVAGKLKTQNLTLRQSSGRELKINKLDFSFGFYEVDGIRVYLLDLVSPEYSFSAYDYVSIAKPIIEDLSEKNILPIVVGGTGFYIKVLLGGVDTILVPPNEKLRKFLENRTVEGLVRLLKKSDLKKYQLMNESDRENKRRLIRAIEIAKYQKPNEQISTVNKLEGFEVLMIGLYADRETIKQRIDERGQRRIEEGAFEEAERLFRNYENLSSSVKNANGYKQLFEYLMGKVTKEEAVENWRRAEYLNAKKQMTWFRKDKRVRWFDITENNFGYNVFSYVEKWLLT